MHVAIPIMIFRQHARGIWHIAIAIVLTVAIYVLLALKSSTAGCAYVRPFCGKSPGRSPDWKLLQKLWCEICSACSLEWPDPISRRGRYRF